jgi:tetratricopeptide (TPR) repeat protein
VLLIKFHSIFIAHLSLIYLCEIVNTEASKQMMQLLKYAVFLHSAGHADQARRCYQEILLTHPNQPNANYNLGVIELEENHVEASLLYFKAALESDPQEEKYWLSYIGGLIQAERFEDARLILGYGLEAGLTGKQVDYFSEALLNRHQILQINAPSSLIEEELIHWFSEQRYVEIEQKLVVLIQEYPNWLVGWKILSDTLLIQGKDATLPAFKALELNAHDAKEHCYYGLVLKSQGDLTGAASAFEQAIELKPDYAAAYNNLGIVNKDMGDVEAGVRNYRLALKLNPGYASCYSNLLFCLSHSEKIGTKALFAEHRKFSEQYERLLKSSQTTHSHSYDPERCLQIGFVSADFRDHALAYFIEPLLNYLSVSMNLTLHAYSNSSITDIVTQRLCEKFSYWHRVDGLSDKLFANKIREDGIDILVDLDGHTAGNRLLTFAMRAAPVQVSWLGYLATTGLKSMDYYLADGYLLPPGRLDEQFTEKLVQLPANAPFTPFEMSPEVNVLPALMNGYMTFACFNRPNKISHNVIKLWSKLLQVLPQAKMLLGGMPQDGSYDNIIEWFALEGINLERLIFHSRSSIQNYLQLHHEVDICLDTFPSNGVTTTCHALWMGVPTLCIEGDRMASRGAMAVMKHVGLDNFVALDEAEFLRQGLLWANNLEQLAEVRMSLRSRFEQSPLAQPEVIAEGLERAFRQMWQAWSNGLPAASFEVQSLLR